MVICKIAEQADRVRPMLSGFWRPQLEWVEESVCTRCRLRCTNDPKSGSSSFGYHIVMLS